MLNEFTSYTSNLDATKNDSTHKVRDRGYCPNGTDIGRPVAGSLPMPTPSSSWNPYLSNLYNYYNPNSYELGNVPQYDNQKCSSQYVRNYNEHSSRFHSTSVLQCCDPRCQLIANHPKYPYHPVNTKINQHSNKRTKNYYGSIVDLPKPEAAVTGFAPPIEHPKYTPCVPYPTLRNDLNGKYSNQPSEYCSPFANTLKRGAADSAGFSEYFTDIGNPALWNKSNTSIWNRNASSYYPSTFESKNTQKIDQGNFGNSGGRGILFNRLLEHREHPYDTGYTPNYYYGPKNDLNPSVNYGQPNLQYEPVISDNRLPLQTNSYQTPAAYNIHYPPPSQTVPQYYKENPPKRASEAVTQETRILDKNPNLDVREFLSTWEDDVDDEKVVEPTNESPVIVLDCSNLEGDVLAKVKEKLNGNAISNNDTAILKIVDISNSGSSTVLSPHTSVIQENSVQSKEANDKSVDSSHTNSDGYMTWYSNGKKKEDFSYDLVEMTERLVNTVGKLLSEPDKKAKPTSSAIKEPTPAQLQESHSRLLPRPLPAPPVLPNTWNPNPDMRKSVNIPSIPPPASNGCLGSVSTASNASYSNYTAEPDRSQQPLSEKNVSCTFNLRKTCNDLKFSVNYSTQQNDYNANKVSDMPAKFKSSEYNQPYYEYHKPSTVNPTINASNYKSYSTYSSYYENTGCNYNQTKLCNTGSYNAGLKDNSLNYVDHIEKHAVSDTDITLVKADLEKSLNEISHTFKSNNCNVEKNCQYFDPNCPNTTEFPPKPDESFKCTERSKVIESQTYNGVIQKTGICNSPVHQVDSTMCNDNLLSMPSLSPPPNSSSTTQPVISSSLVSQNNERPLCGINLTLTDVYENEDTIFDTSQGAETNTFIPFCSANQTPSDQAYQPLNLAVSRDTKPQDSNFKDQPKIPECDEPNKVVEGKTNSKTDDGYYSVENTESDETSGNHPKKSNYGPLSIAYHPCIVSHEQPKLVEIHNMDQSASETIPHTVSFHQKPQDLVISNQLQIGDNCNSNVISSDIIKPVPEPDKENIDDILQGTMIPDKSDEFNQVSSANSCTPILSEDTIDQNDSHSHYNLDYQEKMNGDCDTIPLQNSSNLDKLVDTPHYSETKSSSLEKMTESDEGDRLEKTEIESVQSPKYEQEDTALNLIVQPDTPSSILCESVIKENENFIHHSVKESNISLPILDTNQSEITCAKEVPEPSCNLDILMNEKRSPQSEIVDQDVNFTENDIDCSLRSGNLMEDKVKNDQPKRKLIDTSISNTNLPMKKRRGQDYLTRNLTSVESTVAPAAFITSVVNSVKDSYSPAISMNHHKENEQIIDIPRKNKKKRKKDKSKNSLKMKKYSKFKRHLSCKEPINYQKQSYSFDDHESLNTIVSEINKEDLPVSSTSSSPIYDNNDDMFNIPSVAPTPQVDLIQDFEPQKEQFAEEPPTSFNLSRNICKSDFMNSSIDLHMTKAPSPNCIIQDDSFINEKQPSKAPSPYYDYSYEGVSPSSVAPSPNYDIIEGVLFDDTDSSRNNEDIDCKNKSHVELGNVDEHVDFQERLGDSNRLIKYSITENEYESDYEIDRYYFKRKRDSQVKRLVKKSKDFLKYNHRANKSNNYSHSKFSVNIFRHFDYAVDDERCIRSEDDEYEPRPNHIRDAFKPKSHTNCVKAKDNGKHTKKYNLKCNQRGKKRIVDSTCDLHFNKMNSTYISSPENLLPVNLSSQCDKIISKFQMIEDTRSEQYIPDSIMNDGTFKEEKLNCRSPQVMSRGGSNVSSDVEGDNMATSPAHTGSIHSPRSIMESDTEISDFQDTSKPDSNHLQNSRDIESHVDSLISKEVNVIENQSKSSAEIEENYSPVDSMHTEHFNEQQPLDDSLQLSHNSNDEKILIENGIDNSGENSSSERLVSISDDQEFAAQPNLSFNTESAHSPEANQSNINHVGQYSPKQLEENTCQEVVNDETSASSANQSLPDKVEIESSDILCSNQLPPNKSNTNSPNNDDVPNNLPNIPSEDFSCIKLNDSHHDVGNDENISPSNTTNITRINLSNSDEDCLTKEILHSNSDQLSDSSEYIERTPVTLLGSKQSLHEIGYSSDKPMCGIINSDNNSDISAGENEISISCKIKEDEFINQKNSPVHEKSESFDYVSNSPESAANLSGETEKLLDVENVNKPDSSNLLSSDEYTNEDEKPHSTEDFKSDNISDDQNDNTYLENESVCSSNDIDCNNIIDSIPSTGHISQNIQSLDSVIHNESCSIPTGEVSAISSENCPIVEKNLSEDLSSNEDFSAENEEVDNNTSEAVHSSEPIDGSDELDISTVIPDSPRDILLTQKHIDCNSPEAVDDFDELASDSPEPGIVFNSPSPVAYLDGSIEKAHDMDDVDIDAGHRLSPSTIKDGDDHKSSLESYSQQSILDTFNDNLQISDCNDNICKLVESYQSSLADSVNSDLNLNHETAEDHCDYSDEMLFATDSNSPCNIDQDESLPTSCIETDIAMETGLCDSNCLTNEVPTLRFLALKALSRATINNNLLEVRETAESTEIIIHSDERCDAVDFEDGDSCNLIMTDTFDDDTHVSPNFEALKEMTFDYSSLPESTSNDHEEKNDEDLPCQCLIISSEESILCLRCSLNSSVDASQFHEMDESCEVSVSSLPGGTPTGFDCVEGDCIEQSFIDQEIDFATSPAPTSASVHSSPCPPVVENVEENTAEKTQIKIQLPWHRIFNLGGETNDGDNVESTGVCRQRMLELGPAQIEVRMLSDDCSWWKSSNSSGNSSPVVKVKRLVLQRAAAEAAEIEAEESNSTVQSESQELIVPASEVELRKAVPRKLRKKVRDGEPTLDEILGVPKMVIKKTSCRQYKSYLRTNRILQPVVCLKKSKWLDELALKYQQGSEPVSIYADDIEPKSVEQDAVTIELGEEIVAGANEEAEVSEEIDQKLSEEAGAEVGTEEEIGAGADEEVDVVEEINEEARAAVGTEEIVTGTSEEIVSQELSKEATVDVRSEDGADEQVISSCENELTHVDVPVHYADPVIEVEVHNTQTHMDDSQDISAQELSLGCDSLAEPENLLPENTIEELPQYCSSTSRLLDVKTHFALRAERHHCMLCHLSYNSVEAYKLHLRSRFHRHLELMQRETVHALYRRFTGRPCPSLRPLSARERKIMKWKPRNADVNHFYHHKAPLQIALQSNDPVYSALFSSASR